ncbi:MAG: copper oxidase [Chloroflexota bacterium]
MNKTNNRSSRRDFFKLAGLAGVAGIGLIGCNSRATEPVPTNTPQKATVTPTPNVPPASSTTHTQSAAAHHAVDAVAGQSAQAAEMDAHHEIGTQRFLDNIGKDDGFWNRTLPYRLEGDTKVFDLTCTQTKWAVEPDKIIDAYAFEGVVPGPELRVTEGDNVRINVHNQMNESTCIHWHGLILPNEMDGVPFLTQPLIKPGETFVYEFVAKNPGSHMYHSHHNSLAQVLRGLLGSFIIEPKDKAQDPEYDSDYTMILNDSGVGFSINGKSFPYTQPIVAKLGEKIRIRYMNEGLMIHPMHLHGLEQLVFAKDGWNLPYPYYSDTVNVAPGERWDVIVDCHSPGTWIFHCHILSHAEGPHGMFGMVTAVIVEDV